MSYLPYFVAKYILIISVSVGVLLLSTALDILCAQLKPGLHFLIQIPVLVILVDIFRHWSLDHASDFDITISDMNAAFFFAAPLATFGAKSLFGDIRQLFGLV